MIVDSPLASRFTQAYEDCEGFWDVEAKARVRGGDQPLVFDNLMTVADHEQHRWTVDYLRRKAPPSVVIAGSGMCTGGRVVLPEGAAGRREDGRRLRRLPGSRYAGPGAAGRKEASNHRRKVAERESTGAQSVGILGPRRPGGTAALRGRDPASTGASGTGAWGVRGQARAAQEAGAAPRPHALAQGSGDICRHMY